VKGKGGLTIGNSSKYGDYTRLINSKIVKKRVKA
jgi:hypothetical protein